MIHRASSPVTQFTHRKTCLRVIVVDCQPVEGAFWFVDLFLEMISQMMEFIRLFPWAFKVETFYLSVWVWLRCPWPKIFPKHKNPLLAPKWLPPLACLHAWIAFAFPPLALLSLQTPLAFNFAYSFFTFSQDTPTTWCSPSSAAALMSWRRIWPRSMAATTLSQTRRGWVLGEMRPIFGRGAPQHAVSCHRQRKELNFDAGVHILHFIKPTNEPMKCVFF